MAADEAIAGTEGRYKVNAIVTRAMANRHARNARCIRKPNVTAAFIPEVDPELFNFDTLYWRQDADATN
jgi:hypothetical protein